ncbi:RICIN domain-containing protein [Tamlana sp. 1_MG-2023]|uniref:RICIN domain-containing protein n=1 Tax=Tamlana sp. 1_MG-2023 TaxID=3062628 RepID=UPI0026E321ED|nr:T9SS type A sorting domain-containing protein [Tamlana sp. 1_MG-2023]MDO6792091.1 RICIN domain-containing protein [Tamlana sp. 1_MG-2023]
MKTKTKFVASNKFTFVFIVAYLLLTFNTLEAQVPDPDLGKRADWLRGAWGLNWKPGRSYNGASESDDFTIKHFLAQVSHLETLDYIQIHLNESSIYSPVHVAPHPLIESFWEGDADSNGNLKNLVVPRTSIGRDPFLDIINDIRAQGLKVQVYVNSFNLLNRSDTDPADFPDVSKRWKEWCDTDPQAQKFINAKAYRDYEDYPNRKYMFCYAQFVLRDYAKTYGDLIDAWCFDSGRAIWENAGDIVDSDDVNDQRLYQAFADAVHKGNPDASVAFQNSPGDGAPLNPFTPATLFDDYMFGHPFNGGKNVGAVKNNQWLIDWSVERNGYAHIDDGKSRTWDDYVVAHYDPPMSDNQWNTGVTPGVPDEDFAEYYGKLLLGGGAVSLGVSLVGRYNFEKNLLAQDWTIHQMELLDAYLLENENGSGVTGLTILPEDTIILEVGQVKNFTVGFTPANTSTDIIWDTTQPEIITVNANGKLTAVGEGKANVRAKTADGIVETKTIRVTLPASNTVHITKRSAPGFAIDGGNGSADTQNVYQWASDESNVNQQWIEIDRGDGYYSYQKEATNHCIDGGDGGVKYQNVYLYTCNDTNQNQHWKKVDVGSGYYRLEKRNAPDFSLNGGSGGVNGQNIALWSSASTSQNLQWSITTISNTAKSADSGKIQTQSEVDAFVLYPNPANDIISFNQSIQNARIFDITGKTILTVTKETKNLNISQLQSGVYFLKVYSIEGESIIKKFIKQY